MKKREIKIFLLLFCVLFFFTAIFLTDKKEQFYDSSAVYTISTRNDFEKFLSAVKNGKNRINVRLTNDIYFNDISGYDNWQQSPPEYQCPMVQDYGGTFDGNGYAFIGYYSEAHPVFKKLLEGGCIRNLNVTSSYFATSYERRHIPENEDEDVELGLASGLCASNYGSIEDCTVDGKVMGDGSAAGITAYNAGTVTNCTFTGRVEGGRCILRPEESLDIQRPAWFAGGIAITNLEEGVISNCVNYGDIVLYTDGMKIWRNTDGLLSEVYHESCAGGIAGLNNNHIVKCRNEGNVSCSRVAGGIAGANTNAIKNCENTGSITLLPEENYKKKYSYEYIERAASGISGYNTGNILNCRNTGEVRAASENDSLCVFWISQNKNPFFTNYGETKNCHYVTVKTSQK